MFDFLKKFFGSSTEADSQLNRALTESVKSLDIHVAIASHENWKLRLMAYLDGKSAEEFNPEVICFDDRCDLGKWIHGPGRAQLGKYPGFSALMNSHKMFHYAASNVVALNKTGKTEEARRMLYGQFANFSAQVVGALKAIQQGLDRRGK